MVTIVITVVLILGVGGYAVFKNKQASESEPVIVGGDKDVHGCIGSAGYSWCEAKQKCLRVWEEDCSVPSFKNSQVEKAITDYLLTQKQFSWKTTEGSQNFCGIENLQPESELFPFYVWIYCTEYAVENGELKTLSGTSMPVKINYPNELSYYDLSKFSYEAPRDGTYNGPDIEKIFPQDAQQKISSWDKQIIIKRVETFAFNNILAWESIKQAVNNCEVKKVFQAHSRTVEVELKNGDELSAIEPKIDDIMKIASEAENKCGQIILGTE